ncbi:hypothetical protein LIT38_20340 [Bacillus sp. CMF12]|uniref:hypothetical protein n=1 Tax=Bacillus sp. CMF12 TaxID=2884834 RepID=UPI00207A3AB0|nr:hypothetical protein [Bacillus sp. CMF12]USK48861.1 hypothetical protein LIT38_20340 [Bacillus sp. CMF12]
MWKLILWYWAIDKITQELRRYKMTYEILNIQTVTVGIGGAESQMTIVEVLFTNDEGLSNKSVFELNGIASDEDIMGAITQRGNELKQQQSAVYNLPKKGQI